MLLRLSYFIILEGAKTQKSVTRSVLPLLRKCTHARYYTLLYRIIYTVQHYNDLKTSTQKQITGKSEKFHSVLLIVVTRDNECTRLPFLNCKRANPYCTTEPKWAKVCACRAEYYTQLSDPYCMTCWHQWRRRASFVLMPCFSRVMNRITLGWNHIYSALSLNSLQFTLRTPQLLSNMHTNYLKVTSNTTESTGKILFEKFILARLVKISPSSSGIGGVSNMFACAHYWTPSQRNSSHLTAYSIILNLI